MTVSGQPAFIFLCSQSVMGTSTCSEKSEEFNITTTIPSLPIHIEVYLWSKKHLEAKFNDLPKKDVFDDNNRKIGELKFEDAIKTGNTLQLNLKTLPLVTLVNLEFTLIYAGGAIAPLLATLKTYA